MTHLESSSRALGVVEYVKGRLNATPVHFAALGLLAAGLIGCDNNPYPNSLSEGKTFFVATDDPVSLDPVYCYNTTDDPVDGLIYPSFFHYKYFKRNPFQVELDLGAAEPTRTFVTLTTVDAKGKKHEVHGEKWTYRLRHDIRFQDDPCFPGGKGRNAVAADIVYGFKRMADPKNECPVASYLADKIVGWPSYAEGFPNSKDPAASRSHYDQDIEGVKVDPKDPYSFSITLNQPYPQLRYIMAMHFTTPEAREAVEKYGDDYKLHNPVGCGPFMLNSYRPHQDIYLVRNPNAIPGKYPSEADPQFQSMLGDAGKATPLVDAIYLPVIKEPVTAYNLFQQGYLDGLGVSASNAQIVPASNGLTEEMKERGQKVNRNVEMSIDYMAFNMKDAVFGGLTPKGRKLRQAISLAIDSQAFINLVGQGMGQPANWIIPPGLEGYDPHYVNPYRKFDPNLTEAKKLLAEAGYPNGLDEHGNRLVLHYDANAITPIRRATVRLWQQQIQKLNIQVELEMSSYNAFQEKITKGQSQFFDYGWYADYPDPENFLFLLYGGNLPPGPNGACYRNPKYDELFEQMRAMPNSPKRDDIIRQMRDISVKDCPWIYIEHTETRTLLQPWTKNSLAHPMAVDQRKYIKVDPELRHQLQLQWNRPNYLPLLVFAVIVVAAVIPARSTFKRRMNRQVRKPISTEGTST